MFSIQIPKKKKCMRKILSFLRNSPFQEIMTSLCPSLHILLYKSPDLQNSYTLEKISNVNPPLAFCTLVLIYVW